MQNNQKKKPETVADNCADTGLDHKINNHTIGCPYNKTRES